MTVSMSISRRSMSRSEASDATAEVEAVCGSAGRPDHVHASVSDAIFDALGTGEAWREPRR